MFLVLNLRTLSVVLIPKDVLLHTFFYKFCRKYKTTKFVEKKKTPKGKTDKADLITTESFCLAKDPN